MLSWLQLLAAEKGHSGRTANLTFSHVTDEVLVKFKAGVSEATKAAALNKGKGSRKERLSKTTADELMLVKLTGNSVANAINVRICPLSSALFAQKGTISDPSRSSAANRRRCQRRVR